MVTLPLPSVISMWAMYKVLDGKVKLSTTSVVPQASVGETEKPVSASVGGSLTVIVIGMMSLQSAEISAAAYITVLPVGVNVPAI